MASILAQQFKGISKRSGFIQTFEMLIEKRDEAGSIGHRGQMTTQKKKRLLIDSYITGSCKPPTQENRWKEVCWSPDLYC